MFPCEMRGYLPKEDRHGGKHKHDSNPTSTWMFVWRFRPPPAIWERAAKRYINSPLDFVWPSRCLNDTQSNSQIHPPLQDAALLVGLRGP